ncbi:hypothetical protein MBLNU457_6815t1 [Dothideomycetes sp. NU457]
MTGSQKSTAIGDILQRMVHSDMVTLKVGPQKKVFRVHKNLIIAQSEYFKKAFTGPAWEESHTQVIDLDDAIAILVNVVVAWLYTGRVHYITEHVSDQEAVNLTATAELSPSGQPLKIPEFENPDRWDLSLLVELYIFADRYFFCELKKDLLRHIVDNLHNKRWIPEVEEEAKLLGYIWTSLPRGSGLKTLILDVWAFNFDWEMDENIAALLPRELLTGLLKKVCDRLPYRLCKNCKNEDYRDKITDVDTNVDPSSHEQEVAPFNWDMCIYHEHQDDAEREACEAASVARAEERAKENAEMSTRARRRIGPTEPSTATVAPSKPLHGDIDDVFRRTLFQEMVTVKVGPSKKIFRLHKDILCSRSKYFKTSLTSGFAEARTSVISLDEADENIFCIACLWMYDERLALVAENQGEALRALQVKYKCQSMIADSPSTWPWRLFLDLYVFADRYFLPEMKAEIAKGLWNLQMTEPDLNTIIAAYDELPPDSELFKEALVERYISCGQGPANSLEFGQLPPEFAFLVMNRSIKRAKRNQRST